MRNAAAGVRRVALAALAVLACAGDAAAQDAPRDLRVDVTLRGGLRGGSLRLTITSDGAARATYDAPSDGRVELAFPPSAAVAAEAHRTVVAARWFDAWPAAPSPPDAGTLAVEVTADGRSLRRDDVGPPDLRAPFERLAAPYERQASLTAQLRAGKASPIRGVLVGAGERVASVPLLVEEWISATAGVGDLGVLATASSQLVQLAPPDDGPRALRALFARLDGDRRAAAVEGAAGSLRTGAEAHRAAYRAFWVAEMEASVARRDAFTPAERLAFERVVELLLLDRDARALEVAETLERDGGPGDEPYLVPGLLQTGAAAAELAARLLDAAQARARRNGAHVAGPCVDLLRGRLAVFPRLRDDEQAALQQAVADVLVPALVRRLRDLEERRSIRRRCADVLDAYDGRCRAADERARARAQQARLGDEAARQAARAAPPAPGPLAIAGRLLGAHDLPLEGAQVVAVTRDGRRAGLATAGADGTFRLEGLEPGAYDLVHAEPGTGGEIFVPSAPRVAQGVDAGREGVVARVPGGLLRGRVVAADGAPLAHASVWAVPRARLTTDPRAAVARAQTDARGAFRFVRLADDTYDLYVPSGTVEDGDAWAPGPDERTLRVTPGAGVAGRVVDAVGAAVAGATVELLDPAAWSGVRATRSDATGGFAFDAVDGRRGHVLRAVATAPDGTTRGAVLEGVRGGGADVALRLALASSLRVRVDGAGGAGGTALLRVAGGAPFLRFATGPTLRWEAAPAGTWRVFAEIDDLDPDGARTVRWTAVGTVTTGDAEVTLPTER